MDNIGQVRERQKAKWDDSRDECREYNLINAKEIRAIEDDEVLVVSLSGPNNLEAVKR